MWSASHRGYFAEPGYKDVPELWNAGFPILEFNENGNFIVSKLDEAGGLVSTATVKEQLLYEIHDPESYLTPDVIADFSHATVEEISPNNILIKGISGNRKSGYYKTSVGYQDGYIVEAEISYGGSGCMNRAKLAEEIVRKRIPYTNLPYEELKIDYIGNSSLYGEKTSINLIPEVRLRVAARCEERKEAMAIGQEVEALYTNGPAGGGGVRVHVEEVISIASILIPEADVRVDVVYEEL